MYKVGLSSCGFDLTEENFRKLEKSGIEAVEIARSLSEQNSINHKELSDFSKRYNVELWSYHLPFMPFREIDISSLNKDLREKTVLLLTELIKKAANIGIDKFIIHPSAEPVADNEREERMNFSMESLDRLAESAAKEGAIIAVEDLPRSCLGHTSDDMLRLLSANDKLRVCFDTNHLLLSNNDDNLNFVKKVGDKIITLHVSDYDFIDEKHWLPGEGMINWNVLLSALKDANYQGVWMYELGLDSPKTLQRSRDLTFDDFFHNAHAVFSGQTPSRIY